MEYEELLIKTDYVTVREKPLVGHDGLIHNKKIAIRCDMLAKEKLCTLAEEIGHYITTSGNILNQTIQMNRKQEYRARRFGYDVVVGVNGIIRAYEFGCQNRYQIADYLNVTESYLEECLESYRHKYGAYVRSGNHIVYFEPSLAIERIL